jgi:hypothetical protein
MPGALTADGGARALLPEDPEKGALIDSAAAEGKAPADACPRRETGWQERYFSVWRGAFMYRRNSDFAEVFETSFRGAV